MQRKGDYVNSELGEDMDLDKLIVMDDVSRLADKCDVFSNFLTVSRKLFILRLYFLYNLS